jgi:hypothetical protein
VKDIILLIMLADGALHETRYVDTIDNEWICVQEAAKAEQNGNQAYCIIPAPERTEQFFDYPG